jgi:hypothetical protein
LDEANKERGDLRLRVDEMALKAMVSGASANGDGEFETNCCHGNSSL